MPLTIMNFNKYKIPTVTHVSTIKKLLQHSESLKVGIFENKTMPQKNGRGEWYSYK